MISINKHEDVRINYLGEIFDILEISDESLRDWDIRLVLVVWRWSFVAIGMVLVAWCCYGCFRFVFLDSFEPYFIMFLYISVFHVPFRSPHHEHSSHYRCWLWLIALRMIFDLHPTIRFHRQGINHLVLFSVFCLNSF